MLKILVHCVILFLLTACASPRGQTTPDTGACTSTISEDITVATTLKNSPTACDYYFQRRPGREGSLIGTLEVRSSLTIEAGTVIQFDQDLRLSIEAGGSITAIGTPEARIRLEGREATQGYWSGLCFDQNRESRLEYVDIAWGGKLQSSAGGGGKACSAAMGGVNRDGEVVHIKNSSVTGSNTSGLDAQSVAIGEFEKNVFANNADYSVIAAPDQVHKLDGASDYLGTSLDAPNGKPYIFLAGLYKGEGESVTWHNLNAPYLTEYNYPYGDNIIISDPVTITIEAGARFEFAGEGEFNVWDGASIQAIGTADAPIVFTGKDKTPGSWQGIDFSDAALSVLEHTEVSYAGGESSNGNIYIHGVEAGSDVVIRNSLITNSARCGIAINLESSSLEAIEVTFSNNAENICD